MNGNDGQLDDGAADDGMFDDGQLDSGESPYGFVDLQNTLREPDSDFRDLLELIAEFIHDARHRSETFWMCMDPLVEELEGYLGGRVGMDKDHANWAGRRPAGRLPRTRTRNLEKTWAAIPMKPQDFLEVRT
jgi:hypothetical protein